MDAGQPVETLVSQYVAYLDGRIEEVALDHYAQADDGSVWYFGEDVFDYSDGAIVDTEGTWLAGKDGPAAMIMPADPKVGDVYRAENIPGVVFEEVRVKDVDKTAQGPRGPVAGAMVARELHVDGTRDDKAFAPGYGEFFTGAGGDVEAMALAVRTPTRPGPRRPPPWSRSRRRRRVDRRRGPGLARGRGALRGTPVPGGRCGRTARRRGSRSRGAGAPVAGLASAVRARDPSRAGNAAVAAAQSAPTSSCPIGPPPKSPRPFRALGPPSHRGRRGRNQAGVAATWRRSSGSEIDSPTDSTRGRRHSHRRDLAELRADVVDKDLRGAAAEAARLRATLARL